MNRVKESNKQRKKLLKKVQDDSGDHFLVLESIMSNSKGTSFIGRKPLI